MKPRFIAFYLPQFHPTPYNDEWWGKGYTEWRSVTTARPLFKGHYQPHVPADLGYYDLRLPIIREQQAELAREAGIEGFCYWHYWMGDGRRLLEMPFNEVLKSGKPDFPFCLAWANHNWTNKNWVKQSSLLKEKNIIEQKYSLEDYKAHFMTMLPAFRDSRYICVDGKPLFYIFMPEAIPNAREFIDTWQKLAKENGLAGIYFVGKRQNLNPSLVGKNGQFSIPRTDESAKLYHEILDMGFDAVNSRGYVRAEFLIRNSLKFAAQRFIRKYLRVQTLNRFNYEDIISNLFVEEDREENVFPTLIPNWDRSPRVGKDAVIYENSTPELFGKSVRNALEIVKNKSQEHQIIFIQAWNEWGEGNHLEPDLKYGHGYLDVIKSSILKYKNEWCV